MFVGDEVLLDVTFTVARARLANLARGGSLLSAFNGCLRRGDQWPGPGRPARIRTGYVEAGSGALPGPNRKE